jgi:KEOPS complex subunit Pcc1
MSLACRAELTFRGEHAGVVAKAISPESSERIPRTSVSVEEDEGVLRVVVEADDVASLRAALNSYIRWMHVAEETAKEASSR